MKLLKREGQRTINLENVSTIFVDERKVIFHFNTSRTLKNSDAIVSDYLYWNINPNEQGAYEAFIQAVLDENWVHSPQENHRMINLSNVTNIGTDDYKKKVIFNFNFSISHPYNNGNTIAGFEFWDFRDEEQYEQTKNMLNSTGE